VELGVSTVRRDGFYVCMSMIQLMENVYTDLVLEQSFDHPDNRGWKNLFRHWSWCGMLRVTWAVAAATYGARFQTFCRDRLDLPVGKVEANDTDRATVEKRLNPVELQKLAHLEPPPESKLFPVELWVENPLNPMVKKSFMVGFAIVREKELLYLRIQDHLRRMGLGRRALSYLVKSGSIQSLNLNRAAELGEAPDRGTLERLYESVQAERDGHR
jgi:hypothetical protein